MAAAKPLALGSTKPLDLGQVFLAWLTQGLASGQLPVNTVHARVHRVREGLLLVSPGIFRDYAAAAEAPWANVQKRFQKLRLHRKTPEGFNIWTYTVAGERRTRELKGILLEDPEKALGPDVILPPANVRILLIPKVKSKGGRNKGNGTSNGGKGNGVLVTALPLKGPVPTTMQVTAKGGVILVDGVSGWTCTPLITRCRP